MTATTSIQALAAEAAEWFESKQRENGDSFVTLKDGKPEWVQDLVYKAHGDDFLPDDWRYKWTMNALEFIAEADDPDDSATFADQAVSVYTSDRLAWLASNLQRPGYVDEAMGEFGGPSENDGIVGSIGLGQYYEASEVYGLVLRALEDVSAEVES